MSKFASPNGLFCARFGHFTQPKDSFCSWIKESDGWKKPPEGSRSRSLFISFFLLLHRSRTYARGVLLCPSKCAWSAFDFPSHLTAEGCALPRAEFYSNCCPARQRHSHRSPGDCYPPTTTSRSIITTSSTILISSTSPQRRFERFSFQLFGPLSGPGSSPAALRKGVGGGGVDAIKLGGFGKRRFAVCARCWMEPRWVAGVVFASEGVSLWRGSLAC